MAQAGTGGRSEPTSVGGVRNYLKTISCSRSGLSALPHHPHPKSPPRRGRDFWKGQILRVIFPVSIISLMRDRWGPGEVRSNNRANPARTMRMA